MVMCLEASRNVQGSQHGNEILYVRDAAKPGLVRQGPPCSEMIRFPQHEGDLTNSEYVYLLVTNPLNYYLYYLTRGIHWDWKYKVPFRT
jgi:hypothetical protein